MLKLRTRLQQVVYADHGYARQKAIAWWRRHSPDPVPDTAERAVEIAEGGGVAHTEKITVRSIAGEKYDRIVGYKLGPMPEPIPAGEFGDYDDDRNPVLRPAWTENVNSRSSRLDRNSTCLSPCRPVPAACDPGREAAGAVGVEAVPEAAADRTPAATVVHRLRSRSAC